MTFITYAEAYDYAVEHARGYGIEKIFLRPCRFCRGCPTLTSVTYGTMEVVVSHYCKPQGAGEARKYLNLMTAIAGWNTR